MCLMGTNHIHLCAHPHPSTSNVTFPTSEEATLKLADIGVVKYAGWALQQSLSFVQVIVGLVGSPRL